MQARRILPPRSSRGRMPQQFQQQNIKANFNQKQLTQNIVNIKSPKKKNQRQKLQQKIEISQIQLQYKNMSSYNKLVYPYARGYHYFFDLNSFPRLQNSVTYSIDQNNVFNHTYPQDKKQIKKGLLIGDLLNRGLFGLPYVTSPLTPPKTRTKNPCHHYLFQNEDRKYCVDKNIYQLQQILKNFQKLQANRSLHTFSCLKKDIDLIQIFQDGISSQQKKNILHQKLQIIKQRKESTQQIFIQEDNKFYYHSLNQKLHDEIDIKTNKISFKQIMSQLENTQNLKQNLAKNYLKNEKVTQIFVYKNTHKSCLSSSIKLKLQKVINKYKQKIYNISTPFMFLSFANNMIMTVSQKVLALRLANLNEAAYFVCKDFWKTIFGRNLTINRQIKIFSRNEYQKSVSNALTQLNKWKKQQDLKQKNNPIQKFLPKLDNFVNLSIFDEKSTTLHLFSMQNQVQINSRQYFVLILFYQLYECLAQIHQFIMNYQNLYQIIASQHFHKAYHYFVQLLGSVKMGILQDLLKKLTQWIMRADIDTDFRLYWVYKQDTGIAYILKTKKQTNCQLKKQNQQQSKQQIFDIINLKRTK